MNASRITRSTLALASVATLLTTGSAFVNASAAHAAPVPINGTGVPNDPSVAETQAAESTQASTMSAGTAFLTSNALVRRAPGLDGEIAAVAQLNAQLEVTGVEELGYAEVRHNGESRWVHHSFLSNSRVEDAKPSANGTAVVDKAIAVSDVLIRSSAGNTFHVVAEVPRGTELELTGVTQDGREQVVYDGEVRWVSSALLTGSATVQPLEFLPTAILDGSPLPEVPAYEDAPVPVTADELAGQREARRAQRAAKTEVASTDTAQSGSATDGDKASEQGQQRRASAPSQQTLAQNQGKQNAQSNQGKSRASENGQMNSAPNSAAKDAKRPEAPTASATPISKLPVTPKTETPKPTATVSTPTKASASATASAKPVVTPSPAAPATSARPPVLTPTSAAPVVTPTPSKPVPIIVTTKPAPSPTAVPVVTTQPPAPVVTTQPPTKAPTTQAPAKAPTTQPPTTKAPTPQAPTTKAPTTKAPTTQAPTKAPTTSKLITLPGLTTNAQNVLAKTQVQFPQITTYYGVRPDSLPDHPSGRAVDVMIPNYRTNKALGDQVANWARANASTLKIDYIIWDQKIWSVARSSEGWRPMANRGSDTANHKDHVHITVK